MEHTAIRNTHPMVVQILEDENVKDGKIPFICWDKDNNVIELDKDKFTIELARLQAEQDSNKYQRDRKAEYPDMGDQLDYIFHHGVEKWKEDMIIPVKNKYPKE